MHWKTDQKQSCCVPYCALHKGDCRMRLEPCWQQHTQGHTHTHTHTHTRSLSLTQKHACSLISTLSLWLRFSFNHQSDHTAGVVTICRYLMYDIKVLIQHNNHWSHKRLEIRHTFPKVFACLTHPVASQTSASALGLYSSEEGKVAEFGKHQ